MGPLAFAAIPVRGLTGKPRRRGLTMMIDFGLPLVVQQDLLRMAGDYVDLAKIAIGPEDIIILQNTRLRLGSNLSLVDRA